MVSAIVRVYVWLLHDSRDASWMSFGQMYVGVSVCMYFQINPIERTRSTSYCRISIFRSIATAMCVIRADTTLFRPSVGPSGRQSLPFPSIPFAQQSYAAHCKRAPQKYARQHVTTTSKTREPEFCEKKERRFCVFWGSLCSLATLLPSSHVFCCCMC